MHFLKLHIFFSKIIYVIMIIEHENPTISAYPIARITSGFSFLCLKYVNVDRFSGSRLE